MIRAILVDVFALAVVGCTAMRTVRDPGSYIQARHPERVQVTQADGSSKMLYHPRMVGDSVLGFDGASDVVVPLATIVITEARRFDPARTGVLIGAATAAAVAEWLMSRSWSSDLPCRPCPADVLPDPSGCC